MTGKEICEAWMRRQHPDWSAEDVSREAVAFSAGPSGEPSEAAIEAAAKSIGEDIRIFTEHGVRITDRRIAVNAFRAAAAVDAGQGVPPAGPTL